MLHQSITTTERAKKLAEKEREKHEKARALDAETTDTPASPDASPPPKPKAGKDVAAAQPGSGRKKLRSGRAYGQKPAHSHDDDIENVDVDVPSPPPRGAIATVRPRHRTPYGSALVDPTADLPGFCDTRPACAHHADAGAFSMCNLKNHCIRDYAS